MKAARSLFILGCCLGGGAADSVHVEFRTLGRPGGCRAYAAYRLASVYLAYLDATLE